METNRIHEADERSGNIDSDKLIEERMKEKRKVLREKLRNNLKTIRDRRISGVNNEPFPEGTFERLHRHHIWEKVLGYLIDPSDVTSANSTCKTLAEISEKRRTLMMLGKALDVLKAIAEEAFLDGNWMTQHELRSNHEAISLNLRGVCKAWKDIADVHLFESDLTENDWFLKLVGSKWNGPTSYCTEFEEEKSVELATSALLNSQSAPNNSLVRTLHVSFLTLLHLERARLAPFFVKVKEFLQIHGSSAWFFNFIWSGFRRIDEAYERLFEILQTMPNLKGLVLHFNILERRDGPPLENFHRKLNECPFPALQSMEHLTISCKLDSSLFCQILRNCPSLRSVNHTLSETVTNEVIEALMELTLERYDGMAITILSDGVGVAWPLKHLDISGGPENIFRSSVLFPAINRYQETLQYLCIRESVTMDADATNVRLDLWNLKSLFIDHIRTGTMGLDDLLPLKSLEKIGVESVEYEDQSAIVKVKQCMDRGDMGLSNIWQCFPDLMRFLVESEFGDHTTIIYYRPTPP